MKPHVGIIGVSQTKYEADKSRQSVIETVYEVVKDVMADAGVGRDDLDSIVTSSVDLWDGRTASNQMLADVVGSIMKPESRVAGDGLGAAMQGMMTILSGSSEIVLVVSQCRGSLGNHYGISNWVFDPVYQQTLGLDYLSAGALQANLYMERYGVTQEDCARVVVKNLKDALNNPYAQAAGEVTVDDGLWGARLLNVGGFHQVLVHCFNTPVQLAKWNLECSGTRRKKQVASFSCDADGLLAHAAREEWSLRSGKLLCGRLIVSRTAK